MAKNPKTGASRKRRVQVPVTEMPGTASALIRRALLAWFRAGARVLPWRENRDPYRVWLSEVMLQQTQIAAVVPYYKRFLSAFPTIADLANAPLEQVLELWSGLGYYRRARHLHEAAQAVVREFAGKFPADYTALRSLPGIGDYTAKAVLSIAFNQPYAVLDGNVARVVARLCARRGNLHQREFRSGVEAALAELLSPRAPGTFNQAMMELGQTFCLPRSPCCSACPVVKWCAAYRTGNPEAFPLPRPRRAVERHHLAVALLRRGTTVALLRGLDDGLLSDLWNFPSTFGASAAEALEALRKKLAAYARPPGAGNWRRRRAASSRRELDAPGLTFGDPLAEFRHTITYRAIRGMVYPVEIGHRFSHPALRWFEVANLPQAAISQLARKIVQKILALPRYHRLLKQLRQLLGSGGPR